MQCCPSMVNTTLDRLQQLIGLQKLIKEPTHILTEQIHLHVLIYYLLPNPPS